MATWKKVIGCRLQELRMLSAGCFPLNGHLRISGPGIIRATDLRFGVAVQILPANFLLIQLQPGELLELDILVEWGKGEYLVSETVNQKIPRGWIPLNRNHSPIRKIRTEMVGNLAIAEITTDGSITPEDAIRQASFKISSRLNSKASPVEIVL